ncbi:MAG: helix-turn-helix transcriptional regulator [Chloroflexota bacterium]|nr:helix-turn-helix transcriptional regulator [Chloroflexota bacterium]
MPSRTYGQYCGFARALEVVGERWALLIVRDLTVGPRRFTDLRRGLPGIPTNVLAARLKELEIDGVIQRSVLPRPSAGVVYELTAYGAELEDVVFRLGVWGAKSLGQPRRGETVTLDSLIVALRSTFRPQAARDLRVSYELRLGEIVLHARVDHGRLETGAGPIEAADVAIDTDLAIKALMAGEMSPAEAIASGSVRLTGDPALLDRFAQMFQIPPLPTPRPPD